MTSSVPKARLLHPVTAAEVDGHGAPAFAPAEQIGSARDRGRRRLAWILAIAAHGVLAVLAFLGDREHRQPVAPRTIPVMVQGIAAPPPPPVETPPPPRPRIAHARSSPPPAAAQSAKVIASQPSPETPVDLQNFTMPTGTSDSYAGGFTASAGTSTTAVTSSAAQAHGVVGGEGSSPGSLARAAAPARSDWSCAWPDEEQSSDLLDARVRLQVHVDRDGHAESVDVSSSPTPAFAEAARLCAKGELFRSARDDAGHNIASVTSAFVVHFVR
jgi:outer membrane biosynthesis protein TonB